MESATETIDIKCVQLFKTFRDFWMRPRVKAVDGVDLEVRRGEVFGLLGPNGSGKSTTIKMILGLLTPTSGRIAVLSRRPRHVDTKKYIGYLPEESYLYRFLSARETLDFYGRLFRIPTSIRRQRVDMLLEMVGLDAVEHRPVGEFSKGMQRRVGLAQSLINDPQLLILDEPTSGMDPVGARQIKDVISSLAARGKTILLCTHLLSDVEDLCSRVAIMYGGRVRAVGPIEDLLAEEHLTNLQTETLSQDVLAEVEALLARRGVSLKSVQQPRRRLESLFLEIVDRARQEGLTTSGARNGGHLAAFLQQNDSTAGDPPSEEDESRQLLDSLTASEPAAAEPVGPNSVGTQPPAIDQTTEATESVDIPSALDSLVIRPQSESTAGTGPTSTTTAAQTNTDCEEDTGVDSSMLDALVKK